MGIVEVALLLILEDLVGLRYGLELGLGLFADGFGDLVGVVLEGGLERRVWSAMVRRAQGPVAAWFTHLAVGLLDLILRGSLIDAEEFWISVSEDPPVDVAVLAGQQAGEDEP
jgi:hypothetical protein